MIKEVNGKKPVIHETAYVHETALVCGEVEIMENASVWPYAIIRGDKCSITIGKNTNIQDAGVLHTDVDIPMVIGDNVVVGHAAVLHGCEIGENTLVGIRSVVLNHAKIGKNCMVAAGALVTPGKEFPDGAVIMGSPAKAAREIKPEELERQAELVGEYVCESKLFRDTEKDVPV